MVRLSVFRRFLETVTNVAGRYRTPSASLGRQQFTCFLVATFASAIGRNGYLLACSWLLVAQGSGSASVAVFFAVISVTELLASSIAGWMADRWDRRRLYMIADGMRSATLVGLGVFMTIADIPAAIWMSAALFATCDRIALTASQSMIPGVADRVSLSTANSVVFFIMQSGSLVAAALTGFLLHMSTPTHTFTLLAAAFALSVGFMLAVRQHKGPCAPNSPRQRTKLEIDAAMVELAAIYALLYTGGVLVSVVGPSFVFEEKAGTAIDFGTLESAWSAGSIVGALLLIPLIRTAKIPTLQLAILAMTACAFALLKVLDLPWSFLIFALLGGLYNLGRVAVEVRLQSTIGGGALGRAKGALHSVAVLFGVMLFGVVALLGDQMIPSSIFLAYSFVLAAAALALCSPVYRFN